ncbi:MAG: hypothetical protein LBJ87_00675, partial [bacterium]|nr:hypothetical protein [bacterium]
TYVSFDLRLAPMPPSLSTFVGLWARYDVAWYMQIAAHGYADPLMANFFPLFPMLTGGLSWLLGNGAGPIYFQRPDHLQMVAGMLISNVGLLVGLLALARLAHLERERDDDRDAGPRAALLMLAYPFAMVWTIPYAEGLFVALAALTLLFARQRNWYWAALTAALCGLTRPVAAILVLPLAWEYGSHHGWWRWPPQLHVRDVGGGLAVIGAVPLAMAAYFGYLYLRFQSLAVLFSNLGAHWERVVQPYWRTFLQAGHRVLFDRGTSVLAFESALIAAFAVLVVVSIRRIPLSYALWVGGLIAMAAIAPTPSATDLLYGTSRYLAGALPIYLIVADWTRDRRWLGSLLIAGGFTLQGTLTIALFEDRSII